MEVFLFGFPDFNSIRLVYGGGVIRHTGFYERVIGSAFSFHRTKNLLKRKLEFYRNEIQTSFCSCFSLFSQALCFSQNCCHLFQPCIKVVFKSPLTFKAEYLENGNHGITLLFIDTVCTVPRFLTMLVRNSIK